MGSSRVSRDTSRGAASGAWCSGRKVDSALRPHVCRSLPCATRWLRVGCAPRSARISSPDRCASAFLRACVAAVDVHNAPSPWMGEWEEVG